MIPLPLFIYRFTRIGFFVHPLPLLSRTSQTPKWSQVCLSSALINHLTTWRVNVESVQTVHILREPTAQLHMLFDEIREEHKN